MKNLTLLIIFFAFCINATAKDNNLKLAGVKNLAGIDKISYVSPVSKKLDKFNSESLLAPVT